MPLILGKVNTVGKIHYVTVGKGYTIRDNPFNPLTKQPASETNRGAAATACSKSHLLESLALTALVMDTIGEGVCSSYSAAQ